MGFATFTALINLKYFLGEINNKTNWIVAAL